MKNKPWYPVWTTVHEEVEEGGWSCLITDLMVLAIKTLVFVFFGFSAIYLFAWGFADQLVRSGVSAECIEQISSI